MQRLSKDIDDRQPLNKTLLLSRVAIARLDAMNCDFSPNKEKGFESSPLPATKVILFPSPTRKGREGVGG
ncbi:MAG: hypothetical protein RMZ41_027120 [Nostoc sp. DedVER02]|uniref:hypothetical protein n=1 Tax=unclassified Nostoc TaxID=2593658 RepID=UPI002AD36CBF|nr:MULTISPECIES: hypothetical protein [unclassified Nostoc]MDZ7988336.1 hypothetical protein [Nostoc sp. DedVER02]MDZ8115488.1 hypothetical protein [Nostoc sp. DedVER01b]